MTRRVKVRTITVLCCLGVFVSAHAVPQQAKEAATPQSPVTITKTVNVVLVPVLVRDAHGSVVGNLKKEDFQVFDDGKPQVISGFTIERRGSLQSGIKAADSAPGIPSVAAPPPPPVVAHRFIVFLFDDMHLDPADLVRVQEAGIKMLAGSLAEADMAAVVSFSGDNTGLTSDRAVLQHAIGKLRLQGIYRHVDRSCPDIDFYKADLIHNKHDLTAFEAAVQDTLACANLDPQLQRKQAELITNTAAMQSLAIGEQDIHATLSFLKEFVRRMSDLPGQRTLILVSPGFLTITRDDMTEKSEIVDMAAQSNVTISALDARGLYTTQLDASSRGPASKMAEVMGLESQYHRDVMSLSEDAMAELADGTGGTFFHNNNDLENGFEQLTLAPEYLYVLEFSLQNAKQDGKYHRLKVKVNQDGLQLQARRGYFVPMPAKDKK